MTLRSRSGAVDSQLSDAVVLYFGNHRQSGSFPADVIARYGEDTGIALIERIKLIQQEAFAVPPNWQTENLSQATKRVRDAVSLSHAELSDDAIQILGNYFAFEWK